MYPVIALILGLVVGVVITFFVLRAQSQQLIDRVKAGEDAIKLADSAAREAREMLKSMEGERGQLDVRLEEYQEQLQRLSSANEELNSRYVNAREELRGLTQQLEERELAFSQREAKLMKDEERLKETFENLSSKALGQSMEEFVKRSDELLKQYKEAAKGDTNEKKAEIEKLLSPMKETLGKMEEHNRLIEKEREGAYRELNSQIQQLSGGTQRLIGALQGSASAGRFGEVVLQRVVELAGMTERVTYFTQESIETEDGRHRPDMLVALPGGRTIIVDAKAPVHELDDVDARTPEEHKLISKTVAGKVLEYAKSLNRKDYARMDESPDFTVMFVASESAFRAACEGRPDLIEAAMNHNVVIATPSTLLALLRAVAYGWKQERLASEAKEVQANAKKLYEGLATMVEHYTNLGKKIKDVGKVYNQFGGSLDRTVMPAARKFADAGISSQKELPESVVVEFEPRELKAQDFSALPGTE